MSAENTQHHRIYAPRVGVREVVLWLVLVVAAVPFDEPLSDLFRSKFAEKAGDFLGFFDFMGGYPIHALVIAILLSFVNRWKLVRSYFACMLTATVTSQLIKYSVGRGRPFLRLGPLHFAPWSKAGLSMTSFPSGDACASMALAVLLGIYFPRSRWLFVAMAVCAALARIALRRHYLSDIIFGAGLGYLAVTAVHRWLGDDWFRVGEELPASENKA